MRIHGIDHGIDHGILMLHFMRIENTSGSFFGTEWNHIGSRDGGLNAIQNGLLQMLYWGCIQCIPLGNVKICSFWHSKLFHGPIIFWWVFVSATFGPQKNQISTTLTSGNIETPVLNPKSLNMNGCCEQYLIHNETNQHPWIWRATKHVWSYRHFGLLPSYM